ncbi:unnamed protein product [Rotaria sordida]|uniref:Protein UNC80 C-terminal domain-containing protein n=1 Tax=Rotaria sordida TaxID=392033 RepID=A0A814V0M6_9BILA|nr:unnamed protein product [Rotaria sordida]CAF1446021.1 unnamed protein product [Rotaria sordida]
MLDFDDQSDVIHTNKIQPINLIRLLIALEQTSVDAMRDDYSILELVKDDTSTNKSSIITSTTISVANMTVVAELGQGSMIALATIKTLDYCYGDDDTIFTVLNCIDDCVTVEREEVKIIGKLSIGIKTMIGASESLTRTFVRPKHDTLTDGDKHKKASEVRWSRDTLLFVISTFAHFSTQHLKELIKLINDRTLRIHEALNAKSHTCLANMAHALLELDGYDSITMSYRGIQNYFQKLLP